MEIEADIQINGQKSLYRMYNSTEERDAAFLTYSNLLSPQIFISRATIAINASRLASRGKNIIATISKTLSRQRQARHLLGNMKLTDGGYMNSIADAEKVLAAVHSGEAIYVGQSSNNMPIFRYNGVTGTNVNTGAGFPLQQTNLFMVKGTTSVSIVPYSPAFVP